MDGTRDDVSIPSHDMTRVGRASAGRPYNTREDK